MENNNFFVSLAKYTGLIITAPLWLPFVIAFYMLPPVWLYYIMKWAVKSAIRECKELD